jgi:high-affinity nickel permease
MTHDNRNRAGKTFAQLLGIGTVIVVANVFVNAMVLPHIELPNLPRLPDIPGWIGTVVGKIKLIVLAIVILLAVVGEQTARRRGRDFA